MTWKVCICAHVNDSFCKSHRIRWPEVMVKNGGIHFDGVKFDIKLKLIPSISFWQPELNPDFFFSWRL